MNQTDIQAASTAIRKRLFNLLFQSFSAVIITILILVMGAIFVIYYRVSNYYPPFRPMLSNTLEAYYLGRGSWEGVENLIPKGPPGILSMQQNEWRDSVLLSADRKILLDHGTTDSPNLGKEYRLVPGDLPVPIHINGREVGLLVVTRIPTGFDVLDTLLLPFGTITFFLGSLTILIGLLLSRRLIQPLAEVIAASRAVTSGNLSARVKVQGPDDLKVLSDSFNQMAGSLEKNVREQRGIIADIAHELRTPLTIMQGKLEGIMDGIYPADTTHIQPILEETCRLEDLISDLDTLAQADSNQLKFNIAPFDVNKLARQAISVFDIEAGEKHIILKLEPEKNLPLAMGDPQRISQVINNLMSNAIRYISDGGNIILSTSRVDDGVQLIVCDNGPGVPEEDLTRIFDRFWRGEKSRSREWGGAGLGLAIARQFVEIQGGRIYAANRPEGGLIVGFVLPEVKVQTG